MNCIQVRVSAEDLQRVNKTLVEAEDGKGGYLATLDVYHHLHCIVHQLQISSDIYDLLTTISENVKDFLAPEYYKHEVAKHVTAPGDTYPTHIGDFITLRNRLGVLMRLPDHCLDLIQQHLMCQGDVSMYTYDRMPNSNMIMPNSEIEHVCMDWDRLHKWAADRAIGRS